MTITRVLRIAGPLLVFLVLASPRVAAQQIAEQAEQPEREVSVESERSLTLDDIERMSREGLDDDVIVAAIQASTSVWNLHVDEILALKRRGVSDRVLAAIVRTGVIQKHYGSPPARDDDADRHAVSGNVVVERYVPTYVPRRPYRRTYVSLGLGWRVPWYGSYYTDPWACSTWPSPYYGGYWGGHYYDGHTYGGHYGGHHSGSWGSYSTHHGSNHHGGHKPSAGPRASSGGRGGRR